MRTKILERIIIATLSILIFSQVVSAGTASASFTLANNPPPNIDQVTVMDADAGCSIESWDVGANYTTHMLNATINWSGASDSNLDTLYTFVCIGSDYGLIENITNTTLHNVSVGIAEDVNFVTAGCDVINLFNYSDNGTSTKFGIIDQTEGNETEFNNNTGNYSLDYNINPDEPLEFYGLIQRFDNASASNVSDIFQFNITLTNRQPYWGTGYAGTQGIIVTGDVAGFSPTINETANLTPDFVFNAATNYEDGTGADKCPADVINYTFVVANDSGFKEIQFVNTSNDENFYWSGSLHPSLQYNGTETEEGGWSNTTFYIRINATDGLTGGNSIETEFDMQLTNELPVYPTSYSLNQTDTSDPLLSTHNQTPEFFWFGTTDRENDVVTYYVTAGTSAGASNIVGEETTAAILETNTTSSFFSTVINYSNEGITEDLGQWANETVHITIRVNDSATAIFRDKNGASNYSDSFQLTNFLPNVTSVEIHDAASSSGYVACNDRNNTNAECDLTPVANRNVSLAVRINVTDADGDCNDEWYGSFDDGDGTTTNVSAFIMLCINNTNDQDCTDGIGNFTNRLDNVSLIRGAAGDVLENNVDSNTTCEYTFNTNITAADARSPMFWLKGGVYMFHLNVTDQAGLIFGDSIADNATFSVKGGKWTYNEVSAVNFTDTIVPGDSAGNNDLGTFNDGDNEYLMYNAGNNIIVTKWTSTNFTLAGSLKNWSLKADDGLSEGDNDFEIDDDIYQGSDLEVANSVKNLSAVFIVNEPGDSTTINGYFNYSSGYQLCYTDACDPDVSNTWWNESVKLSFHMRPPTGLTAGTYAATITYNIEDCGFAECENDKY